MAKIKNRRDELLQAMRPRIRAINATDSKPYVISAWIPGILEEPGQVLLMHRPPVPISVPANFENSVFTCNTQPTIDQIFYLNRANSETIATITFYTGSNFYAGSYYYSGSNYREITGSPYRPYTGSNGGIFRPTEVYEDLNIIQINAYEPISLEVDPLFSDSTIANFSLALRFNR